VGEWIALNGPPPEADATRCLETPCRSEQPGGIDAERVGDLGNGPLRPVQGVEDRSLPRCPTWWLVPRARRADDPGRGITMGRPLAPTNEFEKARQVPITADTHYAAGQLAESQDQLGRAVEQYQKALTKDQKHRRTIYRLGVVYTKRRQYDLAVRMWQKYLDLTGDDPSARATAHANLGFCYELAGRGDEAEAAYLRGVRADPKNGPCRINYVLALAPLQLQAVLTPAEVHYNAASVYEWMGRREQARVEYRKELQLDPKLSDAQARLEAMN
jgi:tetratricopeptide (TPR) repeat protein